MKTLLLIAHAPSENTRRMVQAILQGASREDIEGVQVIQRSPFEAGPEDVLAADAVLLMTPENLGYMSGALKDFFDRSYYPLLDQTDGLSYALCVRAGSDGTGTCRAVQAIMNGLRWKAVAEPLVCRGAWQEDFLASCGELGALLAAGLEAGLF
ncbi:MAG: NAD(P)H-dependent oxidoreductase [Myxococcota bacterium]